MVTAYNTEWDEENGQAWEIKNFIELTDEDVLNMKVITTDIKIKLLYQNDLLYVSLCDTFDTELWKKCVSQVYHDSYDIVPRNLYEHIIKALENNNHGIDISQIRRDIPYDTEKILNSFYINIYRILLKTEKQSPYSTNTKRLSPSWSCIACTFHNKNMSDLTCGMCDREREDMSRKRDICIPRMSSELKKRRRVKLKAGQMASTSEKNHDNQDMKIIRHRIRRYLSGDPIVWCNEWQFFIKFEDVSLDTVVTIDDCFFMYGKDACV